LGRLRRRQALKAAFLTPPASPQAASPPAIEAARRRGRPRGPHVVGRSQPPGKARPSDRARWL